MNGAFWRSSRLRVTDWPDFVLSLSLSSPSRFFTMVDQNHIRTIARTFWVLIVASYCCVRMDYFGSIPVATVIWWKVKLHWLIRPKLKWSKKSLFVFDSSDEIILNSAIRSEFKKKQKFNLQKLEIRTRHVNAEVLRESFMIGQLCVFNNSAHRYRHKLKMLDMLLLTLTKTLLKTDFQKTFFGNFDSFLKFFPFLKRL